MPKPEKFLLAIKTEKFWLSIRTEVRFALDDTQAVEVLTVDKDGDLTDWTHAAISKED